MEKHQFASLASMITILVGRRLDSVDIENLSEAMKPTQQDYVGFNLAYYKQARSLQKSGLKIDAIKELRNAFMPRLSLKDAKDIVESW